MSKSKSSKVPSGQPSHSTDVSLGNQTYFCVLCNASNLPGTNVEQYQCFNTNIELKNHLRRCHLMESPPEENQAINRWIETHIQYQDSLNKSMRQSPRAIPDRFQTLYKGCLVCDRIK